MLNHVVTLKDYYKNLKWYQKWFFPGKLKKLLEIAVHPDADVANTVSNLDILKATFDNSWSFEGIWFFQKFFYSGLSAFYNAPAIEPCQWLWEHQLLTNVIVDHNCSQQSAALVRDIYMSIGVDNQNILAQKIEALERFALDNDLGAQAIHLQSIAGSLKHLNEVGHLHTNAGLGHFNQVLLCSSSTELLKIFELLHDAGLLTQDNIRLLFSCNINFVLSALTILNNANLFPGEHAREYFEIIVQNQNIGGIAEAFRLLVQARQLNRENILTVAGHLSPSGVAQCLIKMHELGLLRGERATANRDCLSTLKNPSHLAKILEKLRHVAMPQPIFDSVKKYADILCVDESMDLWQVAYMKISRWIEMLVICVKYENTPEVGRIVWQEYARTIQIHARKSSQDLLIGTDVNLASVLNKVHEHVLKRDPEGFARVIVQLQSVGLLNDSLTVEIQINWVLHQDFKAINPLIHMMIDAGLLNADNAKNHFERLMSVEDLSPVAQVLDLIYSLGLLGHEEVQEIFNWLMTASNLELFLEILHVINEVKLLESEQHALNNIVQIIKHKEWLTLKRALDVMRDNYLSEPQTRQANFNALIKQPQLKKFIHALNRLEILNRDSFFTVNEAQLNFNVLVAHKSPDEALDALCTMKAGGLLNQSIDAQMYRDAIMESAEPMMLARVFVDLYKSHLLAPNPHAEVHRQLVMKHAFPLYTAEALIELHKCNLLYPNKDAPAIHAAIAGSKEPQNMAEALIFAHNNELIPSQTEFARLNHEVIISSLLPIQAVEAMVILNEADLLKEDETSLVVRKMISSSPDPVSMAHFFMSLADKKILIKMLNLVLILEKSGLLSSEYYRDAVEELFKNADILCDDEVYDFLVDSNTTIEGIQTIINTPECLESKDNCITFISTAKEQQLRQELTRVMNAARGQGIFSGSGRSVASSPGGSVLTADDDAVGLDIFHDM